MYVEINVLSNPVENFIIPQTYFSVTCCMEKDELANFYFHLCFIHSNISDIFKLLKLFAWCLL